MVKRIDSLLIRLKSWVLDCKFEAMTDKILLLALLILASCTAKNSNPVPPIEVNTFEGEVIDINDYTDNGKIQLISLWATWCGPCKLELNALEKVYPKWKEKYDLEIIAITVDNKRMVKRASAMAEKEAWPYTFFSDPDGALTENLGVKGIPYSMLIDQAGNIVSTSEGYYDGYEAEMEKKILALAN